MLAAIRGAIRRIRDGSRRGSQYGSKHSGPGPFFPFSGPVGGGVDDAPVAGIRRSPVSLRWVSLNPCSIDHLIAA